MARVFMENSPFLWKLQAAVGSRRHKRLGIYARSSRGRKKEAGLAFALLPLVFAVCTDRMPPLFISEHSSQKRQKSLQKRHSLVIPEPLNTESSALSLNGGVTLGSVGGFRKLDKSQCDQSWLFPARSAIFGGLLAGQNWCRRETANPLKTGYF